MVGVELKVTNLEDLKAAAEICGLEFRENQKTHRWYGNWVNDYSQSNAAYRNIGVDPKNYGKCEHALAVKNNPSAYEIGVVRADDGTYRLMYDFYGSHGRALQNCVGNNADKLQTEYGVAAATRAARQRGNIVRRENLDNGRIKLTIGVK
jgi:hypothetical protein